MCEPTDVLIERLTAERDKAREDAANRKVQAGFHMAEARDLRIAVRKHIRAGGKMSNDPEMDALECGVTEEDLEKALRNSGRIAREKRHQDVRQMAERLYEAYTGKPGAGWPNFEMDYDLKERWMRVAEVATPARPADFFWG